MSMASSLFKWLLIPVLAAGLTSASPPAPHPFHVSVLEINHNGTDRTLEISCKIFTDDFEKVLAKNYKAKIDLINPSNRNMMDSLVKKYILAHTSLKADGKPAVFHYLGFENEKEAAFAYLEVENIPSVSKIEVTTNLMHDLFEDQVNIIHVTVGGNRKSNKLDYPVTQTVFNF